MKIKNIRLRNFRRFEDLTMSNLPPAKLVVLAGPNGAGKSSLFDSFSIWKQARYNGLNWDAKYHSRSTGLPNWQNNVEIDFHTDPDPKKAFYLRTAYRNDPSFSLHNLSRQGDPADEHPHRRMIETETTVSSNYQRLASDAFEDVFARESEATTVGEFREKVIGELRDAILRLFPHLVLNTLGNPLSEGTFRFDKGTQKGFAYTNLSGGEKAAFDLLLDLVVKRRTFDDTVYAIDEPEAHMNTRLQGVLLEELVKLVPDGSQIWIATHSIGMMRKARELYAANPSDVLFLDFGDRDFDQAEVIEPSVPTRAFWERVLHVALDDLAELVAPKEIVLCEGNPATPVGGKNEEHDAQCYDRIFAAEFPDTTFVSTGSSKEVSGDRLRFATGFKKVAKGISIKRLIDRDDHAPADVAKYEAEGIRVLSRRHLEAYLYDEEILGALYNLHVRAADFPAAQTARTAALAASRSRGNPANDVKSAAGDIYTFVKQHLGLTGCGNDQQSFARSTLTPLVKPGMTVYEQLKKDIFS
jgi:predicted ATPase